MVSQASRRWRNFRPTVTGCTTWPAMSGNGAVIGIGRMPMLNSRWRALIRFIIRKGRRRASIPTVTNPNVFNDKEWVGVDIRPTSPFFGRIYVVWDRIVGIAQPPVIRLPG